MSLSVDLKQLQKLRADLAKVSTKVKDKKSLLDAAGKYMTLTEIPLIFREEGPGWAKNRRGGKILRDTGALASSVVYSIDGNTLTVGSKLPYANANNYGMHITPKGKFLAIPDERLSRKERTNFRLSNWRDTFIKPTTNGYTVYQRTGNRGTPRIIAHLVPSVDIPKREFLKWTPRAMSAIANRWLKLIMKKDN